MKYIIIVSFILLIILIINKRTSIDKKIEFFLEFIHIPKNAGTTIENIANEKNIKWGRFKPEHKKTVLNKNCTYWHTPPKYFNNNSLYKKDETFCVIRDPYDRIVSEYKYRNNKKKHSPTHMNEWIQNNLIPLNYVDGGMNCHFIPQYHYIYDDNDKQTCNHILNFNNLSNDFNNMTKKYNIDLQLSKSRKDNNTINSVTVNDLNDDTKQLIKTVYYKDFDILPN
jgi:hypothetical protein